MITEHDVALISQRLKSSFDRMIEEAVTRPLDTFFVAALPDPTDKRWLWRRIGLFDGASGKPTAVCNGTKWVYEDGSAV